MKTKICFVILFLAVCLAGCNNDENEPDPNGPKITEVNGAIKSPESYTYTVPFSGEGNQNVVITKQPAHAESSELLFLENNLNKGAVYSYTPKKEFVGTDQVELSVTYLPDVPDEEPEPSVYEIIKIKIEVTE